MLTKKIRLVGVIAWLIAGLALPWAALAQTGATFFIFGVDQTQFPVVAFNLRAVDVNNQVVTTLSSSNLSVFENGQPAANVQVTPHTDGPVNYIFVIDQGRTSSYSTNIGLSNMRKAISALVDNNYFVNGVDQVEVMVRQNINSDQTLTLLPATQNGDDLRRFIADFSFARSTGGNTKGLLGVDSAIAEMANLAPQPGVETTAIIFFTTFIEDPAVSTATTAAEQLAASAKSKNISVYVFQTHPSQINKQPLQTLAAGATGLYTHLKRASVDADVNTVYQLVNAQRTYYTVSYRSASAAAGQRLITVGSAQATGAGSTGVYEVTVEPPQVTISEPSADADFRREAKPSADGSNVIFDLNTVSVVADITWPGNPRNLVTAELLANGEPQDKQALQAGETRVEFEWDLGDITTEGPHPVKLEVKVVDELGVEAVGETNVNVEVILPAPTPTPTQPVFVLPTDIPGGTSNVGLIVSVVCLGLLCLSPFPFLVFYITRPSQAPAPLRKMAESIQHTLIGGAPVKMKALATLQVLEGPRGLIGETISITKAITTLGRNAQQVDVVFYPDAASSVSRLHCTIQMDGKTFKITDNGSTSGTRVGGRRLSSNDPTELHDGDEIILGDLGKLGVKLKFSFLADKTQLPASGTASDKTFIMDDYNDDWDKYKDK